MKLLPISEIKIGKRHRKDMGDLDGLATSMADLDMLGPILVRPAGRGRYDLVCGARRLSAAKQLGQTKVPVIVRNLTDDEALKAEYAENTHRKDLTWSEAVATKRALEPIEKKAAKQRQVAAGRERGRGKIASGKLPIAKGRAADKAAKATGKRRRTLEKAVAITQAAEQNPERYRDLAERLAEDDVRVDAVHREMKQRQERAAYEARAECGGDVGDLVGMAKAGRKFKVIYADPPWEFKAYSGRGKQRSPDRYYDTLSLEAIKALPVAPLADDDCALFLWGVWPELPGVLDVIKAWGFDYRTVAFVWVKTTEKAEIIKLDGDGLHWGMGNWTRANTEFCLLATKGSPLRLAEDVRQVIIAPVGEHSAKPEEVRVRIERLLVGPYLELFGRQPVPKWTVWSNEIFAEAAE